MLPYEQASPFFMCIRDGHIKKFRGALGIHRATLTKLNREGYGIYFCAADMGSGARKDKENVVGTQVLWADKDNGALPDDFEPKPTITVQTSPGKYQYYWKLAAPITDIKVIEDLLTRVIDKTGSDPACKDACRLMRVPGFANQKNGFDVEVIGGSGNIYSVVSIKEGFPAMEEVVTDHRVSKAGSFNLSQCIRDILVGESIHASRASLSMHMANTGVREGDCLDMVESLLDVGYEIGNIEAKRYQERKGNNKQVVSSAYLKLKGEVPEYEFNDTLTDMCLYTRLPSLPAGGLKVIVDDIMSNMYHPVYAVAVPLAMHLVGVFGAGGYHLDGVTGTKRRVICMQSGSGKDVVTSYISACIRELADARAENFKGAQSFTPRTVHAELRQFRCRSYIVSEAGIVGQSETGDVASMRAYMLQALAAKADRPLSIRATTADLKAAKEEGASLDVHGTTVNVIAESTVETYAKMMAVSHADVTGMMGREELIFPKPNFDPAIGNRKGFQGVGEEAMSVLHPLAQRFLDHPVTTGLINDPAKAFKAADASKVEKLLDADYTRCCKLRQAHLESRQSIATQYSRLHEKVKCTALILAIADSPYDDPIIEPQHVEWAVKYHAGIIATVTSHLSGEGALSTPMEGCIAYLEKAIKDYPIKAIDKKLTLNAPKRIVQKAWLSRVLDLSNCRPFKNLAETVYFSKGIDARRAVLSEALDRGLLVKTTYEKRDAFILPKRG